MFFRAAVPPEQSTNLNPENQPKERNQKALGTYWICTRPAPTTTPTTSNRYSSPERLFDASHARADRTSSCCFFHPTVSAGVPKSVDSRVRTSTKATVLPPESVSVLATTRSRSRWPFLKRRSMIVQPRASSHRAAIASPLIPRFCRSVNTQAVYARTLV